jgi:hypothetical protein
VTRAYEEIIDFIAAGFTPADVVAFQPSDVARARVAELINLQKAGGLTSDETCELDKYVFLENLMRLSKARARRFLERRRE